jgi:hypothetical protein
VKPVSNGLMTRHPGGLRLGPIAVIPPTVIGRRGAFIAFAVVAYLLDRGDLKAVVARLRRTGGTGR